MGLNPRADGSKSRPHTAGRNPLYGMCFAVFLVATGAAIGGGLRPGGKDMATGTKIRELRNRMGMTQEEFAHALGITVSTVNRWENGHSEPSKLARASILGVAEKKGLTIDPLSFDLSLPEPTPLRAFAGF